VQTRSISASLGFLFSILQSTEHDLPLLSNDSASSRKLPRHVRLGGAGGRAVVEVGVARVRCAFLSFLLAPISRRGSQYEHSASALQCLRRPSFPGAYQHAIARGDGHAILFLSLRRPALGFENGEVRGPGRDSANWVLLHGLSSRISSASAFLRWTGVKHGAALTLPSLSLLWPGLPPLSPGAYSYFFVPPCLTDSYLHSVALKQSREGRERFRWCVLHAHLLPASLPSFPLLSSFRPKDGRGLDAQ
jgi:hypothetical protein